MFNNGLIVIIHWAEEGRGPDVIAGFANDQARMEWLDREQPKLPDDTEFTLTTVDAPFNLSD